MKFEFTGRHIEVTPALRAHVKEQFERVRFLPDGKPSKAHVIIEVERERHRAEIILKWRDKTLAAHATMKDMYQSLSKAIDKLETQVLKKKNKLIDKHQQGRKASAVLAEEKLPASPKRVPSKS